MTTEEIAVDVAELKAKVEPLERGVQNFRNFQADMRDFVSRFEAHEEDRVTAEKKRMWFIGIGAAFITAVFAAGFGVLINQFLQLKGEHRVQSYPYAIGQTTQPQQANQ